MTPGWETKEIEVEDFPQLYHQLAGQWLLLEVVAGHAGGEPRKFRLLGKDRNKSALHEMIMDDDRWDWQKKYLIVLADPTKPCDIR